MKGLINSVLVILVFVTVNYKCFTNAQLSWSLVTGTCTHKNQIIPEVEEIDEEAFIKKYTISSEQVAQHVEDIKSAWRNGFNRAVTYDAQLKKFTFTPFNGSCEEGPIRVLYQDNDPRTYFSPPPLVDRCRGTCPADSQCLANTTRLRRSTVVEFRKFNLWGMITFIPIGVRCLILEDEDDCECVPTCSIKICFPPHVLNEKKCQCECPRKVCWRPFVLDPRTCNCVCHKSTRCRYGYSFNPDKCRCYRKY